MCLASCLSEGGLDFERGGHCAFLLASLVGWRARLVRVLVLLSVVKMLGCALAVEAEAGLEKLEAIYRDEFLDSWFTWGSERKPPFTAGLPATLCRTGSGRSWEVFPRKGSRMGEAGRLE